MTSRGEAGLIVASIGIIEGIIPQNIFSAVVGMVIITTLLTPPLLRWSFREPGATQAIRATSDLSEVQPATEGEKA